MADLNEDERLFTVETLRKARDDTETLRIELLCNVDGHGADPWAEQHYLLGLQALESAERFFSLAALDQARGNAGV